MTDKEILLTGELLEKKAQRITLLETMLSNEVDLRRKWEGLVREQEKQILEANARAAAARDAGTKLLDALEYCHHCGGQLALDDQLVSHCESCPYDCDDHDEPNCTPIYVLHDGLRKALAAISGKEEPRG